MHFLFLHSTGGNPNETWFPWLANELQKRKHSVLVPRFPTPEGQNLENWLITMQPYWKVFDKELVLIGRSIGAPFALRLLEKSPVKIKAAFLVCGFASDLGLPEFSPLINSFISAPFNWQKIRANCGKFFIYNSDDDPYIPLEKGEEIARNVGSKMRVFPNRGHFWDEEFPELLKDIETL